MKLSLLRLAASWLTVIVFVLVGPAMMTNMHQPAIAVGLFAWLLGIVIWSAFGAVHEAEELAEALGEPLGTLLLTLSIVIIEVALISAVMIGAKNAPTLGRDTMFAVLMIVLNGVVGLGLLTGGLRYHQQSYNLQGASAYLAVIIPLTVIALVLPNFTTSTSDGTLSLAQAIFFSIFTIVLYSLFLWLQTGRHRGFFRPVSADADEPGVTALPRNSAGPVSTWRHILLLIANILPIVLLSKCASGAGWHHHRHDRVHAGRYLRASRRIGQSA